MANLLVQLVEASNGTNEALDRRIFPTLEGMEARLLALEQTQNTSPEQRSAGSSRSVSATDELPSMPELPLKTRKEIENFGEAIKKNPSLAEELVSRNIFFSFTFFFFAYRSDFLRHGRV